MSEGVTIPLDVDDTRARGKVARLKRDAADAGREYGRAGSQAARIGGVAGGALGRSLGGFAQGGAAGLIGLGATAAGLGLNAFLQRNTERITEAVARETRQQGREAIQRTVMDRNDARAAGGVKFASVARRIVSGGYDRGTVRNALATGTDYGLTTTESLDTLELSKRTGVDQHDVQVGLASGRLGDSPEEVAKNIRKFNGLHNAVMAIQNVNSAEATEMIQKTTEVGRGQNIARATSGMNPVSESQLADLMSGKTADAVARQAKDELNPAAKLMEQASQVLMDNVRNLQAAANAESTLAGILKEMGRVVGLSEGSASRALKVGGDAASESSGPK